MPQSFGYPAHPADSAVWLDHRRSLIQYLNRLPSPHNWSGWLAAEAPIRGVYRQSPQALGAPPSGSVEADNPPMTTPGMVSVSMDDYAKLLSFEAIPLLDEPLAPAVDPAAVFRAAGLNPAAFHQVTPAFVPAHASDTVLEWKGPHPRIPNLELTVEVASWKGRITQAGDCLSRFGRRRRPVLDRARRRQSHCSVSRYPVWLPWPSLPAATGSRAAPTAKARCAWRARLSCLVRSPGPAPSIRSPATR